MRGFAVYYIEAMFACILMFLFLLIHNRRDMDRQEKQIRLDYALIAFILYFISDCFWAAGEDGLIPRTMLTVKINVFIICILMTSICYFWLKYVMAVVQVPGRNAPAGKSVVLLPFILSATALFINILAAPETLVRDDYSVTDLYSLYLIVVPVIYLAAIFFYTVSRALKEENPEEKRKLITIGMLPLSTVVVGVIQQLLFPYMPIYCFVAVLVVVIFYIQSIEAKVSLDALTGLNNRGEMMRYSSRMSNLHQEGRLTYVIMMDINNFKSINDTYGHAEGDRALVIIADSLKKVVQSFSMATFLGRYGGDEFILMIHPEIGTDVEGLYQDIRRRIDKELEEADAPYELSLSAGYDELKEDGDSIQECIRRADAKLYQDKEAFRSGVR